ncbi:MAG: DUF433 domain-containing protein [Bacteroidota bacterium]
MQPFHATLSSVMPTTQTRYEHVLLDEHGVPMIAETTMKVQELALEHLAYGWSPEELRFQHPYLSLGQIYSALAYYGDHQDALDANIAQRLAEVEQLQHRNAPSPLRQRLREEGRLP